MDNENNEQYISDKALGLIRTVDNILRDKHSGLPSFIFESQTYQEFILPLSVALVSQAECRTVDEFLHWCVDIEQVTFATVDAGVFYQDKAYILRRKFIINELIEKSSVLWNLSVPAITTENGYMNILIFTYKDLPISNNILQNLDQTILMNSILTDIILRVRSVLSFKNSNQYLREGINQLLSYAVDNFPHDSIEHELRPRLQDLLNGYLSKDNKDEKMIEDLAIIMKEFRIIGIGTTETELGL